MKRHPALIPLSSDHHQALLLAVLLKKNSPTFLGLPDDSVGKMNYVMELYEKELKNHFKDEEQILLPYLKEKDVELDALISEILNEHIILKERILSLNDNPNLVNQLDEIGRILDEHVRKEERILFEKAQAILNESELEQIKIIFDQSRSQAKSCNTK